MSDRPGGTGDRRPTKAERKEEARLDRERLQKQMATRNRNRNLGIAAIAVAVALIVAVVVIVRPGGDGGGGGGLPAPQALLDRASAAAADAGCDDIETVAPYGDGSDDQAHIGGEGFPGMPPLDTYPSTPPTSGPHADIPPGPLPAGVYDTLSMDDLARAIHSLEHGATIVWYDPDASGPQLDRLRDFYDRRLSDVAVGQDRVIVAPYDFPGEGGRLPEGVTMALTSWHRLQRCAQPDLAVAYDFTSQYSGPPVEGREYVGDAPEAGAVL